MTDPLTSFGPLASGRALSVHLLGTLEFDAFLALQRRLVYEAGGDRSAGALILCDHPPGITVGREGSRAHIRPSPEELHTRGWPVRWVGRGGGVMLHAPGQVACYPVLSLEAIDRTVSAFVADLQEIILELLRDHDLVGTIDPDRPGVRVNGRRIAHIGVAVHDNVTAFGLVINVDPDLEAFRHVRCDGDAISMTSLQREAAGRVRISGVRQRLSELVAGRFGFERVSVFHAFPGSSPPATLHAAAHRS